MKSLFYILIYLNIYTAFFFNINAQNLNLKFKAQDSISQSTLDSLDLKREVAFWPIIIDQPLHLRATVIPYHIRDKAKELYRDFYDYTSYNNRYLDLHGAANKIISYLESDWEAHGSYKKYCQGVEQTEANQKYMFYQYTNFMDKVRGHNFFETFPQFEELKEEFKEVLEWKLETPNWWVDDE